jgi:hypothetical protein
VRTNVCMCVCMSVRGGVFVCVLVRVCVMRACTRACLLVSPSLIVGRKTWFACIVIIIHIAP